MLPFCFEESSRTCNEKNATKPAQIIASLIQETEHKGKWTSFHLLPDLCPLCFSCCCVKSQTSIRSPLPTRLQQSVSVGSPCLTLSHSLKELTLSLPLGRDLMTHTECSLPMYRMLYSFLQEFHLLTKLGAEQRSQC